MKTCSRCKVEKSKTEFYRHAKTHDGLQSYCKSCSINYGLNRSRSPEGKLYRASEHQKVMIKRRRVRHRYGIELEVIPDKCQIKACGTTKKVCVDHNHETKEIRGFLCDSCNRALGFMKENPEALRQLADYIEEHNNGVCR